MTVPTVLRGFRFTVFWSIEMVGDRPVLTKEIYEFARDVANRQCVALGEILSAAIPDHMARTAITEPSTTLPIGNSSKPFRHALLASGRQELVEGELLPSWMAAFVGAAKSTINGGQSVLLLVPEISDVDALVRA